MNPVFEWSKDNTWQAFLLIVGLYQIWVPLMMPLPMLPIVTGFMFSKSLGPLNGYFIALLACTVGTIPANVDCFLLQRYLLRSCIQKHIVTKMRVIKAVEKGINAQGLKVLIFLRLQPVIPKTIINLIISVTQATLKDYTISVIIGTIPFNLAFCYIGVQINNIA